MTLEVDQLQNARISVRKGKRVGMIVLPEGFGQTAGLFWGEPPQIQLGMDPSRSAESGMLKGFVMKAIAGLASERFQNPDHFKPMISRGWKKSTMPKTSTRSQNKPCEHSWGLSI
ncbi:MAG TPA: hypothetical protein EYG03_09170 [Planctomycetes bacterium]|nr:hypothetical protein [Planctomycetota bacterium]